MWTLALLRGAFMRHEKCRSDHAQLINTINIQAPHHSFKLPLYPIFVDTTEARRLVYLVIENGIKASAETRHHH
jgi:hypothetical protein